MGHSKDFIVRFKHYIKNGIFSSIRLYNVSKKIRLVIQIQLMRDIKILIISTKIKTFSIMMMVVQN